MSTIRSKVVNFVTDKAAAIANKAVMAKHLILTGTENFMAV